jgi:hypothetical protein
MAWCGRVGVVRPRARPRALRNAALALTFLLCAGCQPGRLQFGNDHRLSFIAPRKRQRVAPPFTIRWTIKGFDAAGLDGSADNGHGVFAAFIDRAPMPVGESLKWFARSDKTCAHDPRCPDPQYLADHGVHVTTATSLRIDVLPRVGDGVGDEQHYVNVVLLDGTGRRIGESAWYRAFSSKRRSSS